MALMVLISRLMKKKFVFIRVIRSKENLEEK